MQIWEFERAIMRDGQKDGEGTGSVVVTQFCLLATHGQRYSYFGPQEASNNKYIFLVGEDMLKSLWGLLNSLFSAFNKSSFSIM